MGVFKRQLERKIQHYQSSFEQEYFAYSFVIANSLKVPHSLVIRGKFTQKHLPAWLSLKKGNAVRYQSITCLAYFCEEI